MKDEMRRSLLMLSGFFLPVFLTPCGCWITLPWPDRLKPPRRLTSSMIDKILSYLHRQVPPFWLPCFRQKELWAFIMRYYFVLCLAIAVRAVPAFQDVIDSSDGLSYEPNNQPIKPNELDYNDCDPDNWDDIIDGLDEDQTNNIVPRQDPGTFCKLRTYSSKPQKSSTGSCAQYPNTQLGTCQGRESTRRTSDGIRHVLQCVPGKWLLRLCFDWDTDFSLETVTASSKIEERANKIRYCCKSYDKLVSLFLNNRIMTDVSKGSKYTGNFCHPLTWNHGMEL